MSRENKCFHCGTKFVPYHSSDLFCAYIVKDAGICTISIYDVFQYVKIVVILIVNLRKHTKESIVPKIVQIDLVNYDDIE